MKRILIFHTSVGLGHKIIAQNIAHYLEAAGHTVCLQDVIQAQNQTSISWFISLQQFINKRIPIIWQWLYDWAYIPTLPFRIPVAKFHSGEIKKIIDGFKPDLVISTQTSSSAAVAYLKKKGNYTGRFGIAFSDYHFHPFWIYPGADFYLTNIVEQAVPMMKAGIKPSTIRHIGITLKPQRLVDVGSVKRRFQINDKDRVVLIGTGSLGTRANPTFIAELVQELHKQGDDKALSIKVIISSGRNEIFKEKLEAILEDKAIILGYHTPMDELYAITDFFVTKPGGLSIAEGLQWKLPILITHWLPGQEKQNYEYLKNHTLILPGPTNPYNLTAKKASEMIIEELITGTFKESLIINPHIAQLLQDNDFQPHPVVDAIEE
jgi:processive 1,2-diacylglycerol beta-glucosyltransferase